MAAHLGVTAHGGEVHPLRAVIAERDRPLAARRLDPTTDGLQTEAMFVGGPDYDERCLLPIHVYDTATSRPVMALLRPGKTPSGAEVRGHLRRLVRQIRRHWPSTRITLRGDGHYGHPEVLILCEAEGIDFVFGLPTNAVLRAAPVNGGNNLERWRPRSSRTRASGSSSGSATSMGSRAFGLSEC